MPDWYGPVPVGEYDRPEPSIFREQVANDVRRQLDEDEHTRTVEYDPPPPLPFQRDETDD